MATKTGYVDFKYEGEEFKTWYKIVGDLQNGVRPLVLLHGGPGIAHNYLLPLAALATSHNTPVVFYDQTGIGRSSHAPAKPASFWSVELFVAELDQVLAQLGIAGDFDLLGHSWGGMLAAEYAVRRRPAGLKHLVLTDSLASMPLWERCTNRLLEALPEELREMLKRHEAAGTTEDKEYQEGMMVFYAKHVCRVQPWPKDLNDSFETMAQDPTVYHTMAGPSEFHVIGTLKTWSIVDQLHTIEYPTLVINGAYDEAQDECVQPLFERIPRVKWVQFAESSHMPFIEETERYLNVLGSFLRV
ncbi:proline-specific peptidase [Dentipellis sp. KUC8613]|nr:proline-specific peptidase [Dentipellis sp. KUC8613]